MSDKQYEGIAIIGMAGRFPGAESVEEFWANLVAGRESVSFFTDADLRESGLDLEELRHRGQYIPARGLLKDADCFDAAFFGIHPKEAEVMDPQQRVFLESCWTALERAGYAPGRIQGAVGIFAGTTFNTYYLHALHPRPDLTELVGSELVMFGNERDYLTTRVAYKLGLKGPALNVSTACSTSLVAICQACQSLLTFQCDLALAGGVSVRVPQKSGYFYDEGNIGSSDGHTRTFDAQAAGTVFSNGVAVVALKRLVEAIDDGDRIYAVIKAAALNNDGSQRVSFGAPGVEGQSEVIAMAHALAGVDPETISYVEAHGTATPLGDPIEVAALTKAFRLGTKAKQFCGIGSVKTNIGHLEAAAGAAGLIKTALALHHRTLPASLHFTRPNPKLDLENTPFYVNAALRPWNTVSDVPRRAGVSSFGTGGTNAHVVLEEAPELPWSGPSRPWQLLVLSAKTREALERSTSDLSLHLKEIAAQTNPEGAARELADAAFTLQTGRSDFIHRRIVTCQNAGDGAAALEVRDAKRVFTQQVLQREPPIAFMFTGQGAQYAGMGAELYRGEPVFRAEVDRCADLLRAVLDIDLRTILFPTSESEKVAEQLLVETRFTQPALFVLEYALSRLWMSWGFKPAAMIGHSVGEYVAACLAGVFSLDDALVLVARRAALVQAQPGGAMLAVRLSEQELTPLLNSHLAIAAINSPNLCVVSGPYELVAGLEEQLKSKSIAARRLNTSHAFHSPMMEPVLAPFSELLRQVEFRDPKIPFVSNVTARWITPAEVKSPEYWAGHVRQTVRFADGVRLLMNDVQHVLLEVGPGQTLGTLARQHPAKPAEQVVLSSLPYPGAQEQRGILESLGRLWACGAAVDWQAFYHRERRRRTVLPTYPFERRRFWPEPAAAEALSPSPAKVAQASDDHSVVASPAPSARTSESPTPPHAAPDVQQAPRKERLLTAVRSLLEELSGYDLSAVEPSVSLLELGLDSLLLTQASQLVQRRFGVRITFRQLMEELGSIDSIAAHLDSSLPAEAFAPTPAVGAPVSAAPASTGAPATAVLEQLLEQQKQLTSQLLQILGRQPATEALPRAVAPAVIPLGAKPEIKTHGPFKPIDRAVGTAVSSHQSRALDALVARYTKRTATSKKLAAQNRTVLADPRSVAGFKQLWKEMVYPFVTNRSDGARVWDVDGNEYIDFVMGFGASLFGHRPPFVVEAVRQQLDLGFEIGPIQQLAGEVATLVRDFTGMSRVAFTNTGSEAVLAATRVARTVTARDKIAVFAGAYHGIFDEVLFRPLTVNGETRTAPIAPGIPDSAVSQVMVLDYGNPQSLEILRARGSEIAAVLVEPVQSRRLDLQPREFLQELRGVTEQTGSALIFDEVVTGFRVEPGGAQSYFGVRADLATYGKVIGGGLPIGVVAGAPRFMDALDGGQWEYGDNSFPEVGVTFFAGTFVRHPMALAAAKAVLLHLKQQGPELQRDLNTRTEKAANQLRNIIDEFEAPYHLTQFSSLIQLGLPSEQKFAALLFYLLRDRGIHIWENRAFVMTTAHSEADLAKLAGALGDSLAEMRTSEFLRGSSAIPVPKASAISVPRAVSDSADRDPFPLTEQQKEIWLAAQMGVETALAYNESLRLDFRGEFDAQNFRAALRTIGERHPILLAGISDDGQLQHLNPGATFDAQWIDLGAEKSPERRISELIDHEVSTPFDLAKGPLARVVIGRCSPAHHVVLWTAHHIVCDGWSGGLIVDELGKIYSALVQGNVPQLETPVAFREYALANSLQSPEAHQAVNYWRAQFLEAPAPLDLPLDRPRPRVRTGRADTRKRHLDARLPSLLKRVAAQQRTTLVVLLLASVKTLLCRLSGQSDVVVGIAAAGQAFSEQNCLVGHCVSLLPVRTRLEQAGAFSDALSAVKKNVLDAFEHHQCSLGGLLQHLAVPRLPNRPTLVEVIFNLDRDPGAVNFHGLEFTCERNAKRALHFDLFFNFVEGPRGLLAECDYNSDLFDGVTIDRWLGHLETLLASIVADPSGALDRLPVLTEAERRELTLDSNQSGVSFPKQQTLHGGFERQVERAPDSRAISFEGVDLTYRQLNGHANRLGHRLKKLGVGPEVLVGLFLERSIDMIVGILGILKAGGAYVPMDPSYPRERLGYILEDSRAPIVLTQESLLHGLPTFAGRTVCLDSEWNEIARESGENPGTQVRPECLAYVLFTSGSTGRPKGVALEHSAAVTFVEWATQVFSPEELAGVLFSTSVCFDLSVFEMFVTLSAGGTVILAQNALHLPTLPGKDEVTLINTVPSAMAELLRMRGVPASVKTVNLAGEALSETLAEEIYKTTSAEKLYNLYGPTESTTYSTYTLVRRGSAITIGKAIANTQAYILDTHCNPAPIGVAGELYLAGGGLARGYYGRQDLTDERFVRNPFKAEAGARMYRTGDLCSRLPNGDIRYLGRLDHQVKLHGFRIELGEIETTLNQHPGVRQSLVVVREDEPGLKQLVAYVVPEAGQAPGPEELRQHAGQSLPAFMMPSAVMVLNALPLTPNGKFDRKALPPPNIRQIDARDRFEAPRDPLEQMLARHWAKILGVERVGLRDNFFQLGGHSLLAVRMIVELEKLCGVRLPLAILLRAPTIADLAEVLRRENGTPAWSCMVPMRAEGTKLPFVLMHSHGGNILEYYPLVNRLDSDQPVYAIQARGLDGRIRKGQSLEEMAAYYLKELRILQPRGPYLLGGFCFGGLLALEAAQQLSAAGEEVSLVVMIQTINPSVAGFARDVGLLERWWYRSIKRIDLERENLSTRGSGYVWERLRHGWGTVRTRAGMAFHNRFFNGHGRPSRLTTRYILESLSIEHDKVFEKYIPRPYIGDVLLYRASKQLPGLVADYSLGWKGLIQGNLDICELPGHQQNLMLEPNVARLAEQLGLRLEAAQPAPALTVK